MKNSFIKLFLLSVVALGLFVKCKPEEKSYPKESYLDDFLSAELEYNSNFHLLSVNRDTNHLFVTFNNDPSRKASVTIDGTKNADYYFVLTLRLDSLGGLKAGMQFPINNSNSNGTVSCLHKNTTYSNKEYHANSGTLFIDQLYGYDELKVHFDAKLSNGLGDNIEVKNGKVEYD